jgi:CheY-like chemotaxis protein
MKYLVIDDSKMARRMTIKSLEKIYSDDFEVIQASDGQEGLELYKLNKPDICLMDLTMPIMNGYEATEAICNFDNDANIVVVSADIQENAIKKAQDAGAIGFIKKPVDSESLRSMLAGLELI